MGRISHNRAFLAGWGSPDFHINDQKHFSMLRWIYIFQSFISNSYHDSWVRKFIFSMSVNSELWGFIFNESHKFDLNGVEESRYAQRLGLCDNNL